MKDLEAILALPEGVRRTAALAAWVQALYGSEGRAPVLVGGAAVELYTGGAYTTGDLDFVGRVVPSVAKTLRESGFERRGRHWIHEAGEIFLEFPASDLEGGEQAVELQIEGDVVIVLEPEALVADRLAAWQVWESSQDAVNAWLLTRGRSLDSDRIADLAAAKGVSAAAKRLAEVVERWQEQEPTEEELVEWATNVPGG